MNLRGCNNPALLALTVMALLLVFAGGCRSQRAAPCGNVEGVEQRTADRIVHEARRWIGTPYRYGGKERRRGTDCSGMVMEVYRTTTGIALPRNSARQQEFCRRIKRSELSAGDLVFFSSKRGGSRVSHVGIYIGEGRFIHASSSRGVMESGLDEKYFATHYHSAGRVPGMPTGNVRIQPVAEPVVEQPVAEPPVLELPVAEQLQLPTPDTIAAPDTIPAPVIVAPPAEITEEHTDMPEPAAAPDSTAVSDSIRSAVINAFL